MMKNLRKNIKTFEQFNNEKNYKSFELTEEDLYDIAKWALFQGGYILYNDLSGKDAIEAVVEDFKLILKSDFPEGFGNVPNIMKLYRIVRLKSQSDLNLNELGQSWFSDRNRIKDNNFIDQLFNSKKDLYLIEADVPIGKIDIPRSLVQRTMSYIENEVVLKDSKNIKIDSITKI